MPRRPDSRSTATRRRSAGRCRSAAPAPYTPSRPAPSAPPKSAAPHCYSARDAATSARSRGDDDAEASARPCTALATTRRTFVSTTGTRCPYAKHATRVPCMRRLPATTAGFRRPRAPRRRTRWRSRPRTRAAAWPAAGSRAFPTRAAHPPRWPPQWQTVSATAQPSQPDGLDPRDRCLLQHELADQDLPRSHIGATPRQVTLRVLVPAAEARPNRS